MESRHGRHWHPIVILVPQSDWIRENRAGFIGGLLFWRAKKSRGVSMDGQANYIERKQLVQAPLTLTLGRNDHR
jgi:hypothetical protein